MGAEVTSASFDPEAFRTEVRAFCTRAMPDDIRRKAEEYAYFSKQDRVRWQRILNERGWFVGHWPERCGGGGWGPLQRFIFNEELEYSGAPWIMHFGVSYIGPLLCAFGTPEQQARYLPGIRESTTSWCQGFSEPGAGSDLANVQTRAVRDGDSYIVTGQKTWTTMAHWADMMFALVRTSSEGARQSGISMLLIDLNAPGVTVRPIQTIDGQSHVNEVFLDGVRVLGEDRVGEEGDGWACAKFIVDNERLLVTELGKARRLYEELVQCAAPTFGIRRRVAALGVELETLSALAYRVAADAEAGLAAGIDASILKIRGSQLQQALHEALVKAKCGGMLPAPSDGAGICPDYHAGLVAEHLHTRATSIYGGSNEIQANIIARAVCAS